MHIHRHMHARIACMHMHTQSMSETCFKCKHKYFRLLDMPKLPSRKLPVLAYHDQANMTCLAHAFLECNGSTSHTQVCQQARALAAVWFPCVHPLASSCCTACHATDIAGRAAQLQQQQADAQTRQAAKAHMARPAKHHTHEAHRLLHCCSPET